MDWVVESQRLGLRPMTEDDFDSLCVFLQDAEVMAAWEHAFSDDEVRAWIAENRRRYAAGEPSYYVAVEKATGGIVGAMGPLIETIGDERHMGVAYILAKAHWGRGLAAEAPAWPTLFPVWGPAGSLRKSGRKTVDPAGWRNGWACR